MSTQSESQVVSQLKQLTGDFEQNLVPLISDQSLLTGVLEQFQTVIGKFLADGLPTTKPAGKTTKPVGKTTKPCQTRRKKTADTDKSAQICTWQRAWFSSQVGGKAKFPELYEEIRKATKDKGEKFYYYSAMNQMLEKLKEEEGQTKLIEWAEWVRTQLPNPPTGQPFELNTTKKSPRPLVQLAKPTSSKLVTSLASESEHQPEDLETDLLETGFSLKDVENVVDSESEIQVKQTILKVKQNQKTQPNKKSNISTTKSNISTTKSNKSTKIQKTLEDSDLEDSDVSCDL